MMLHLLGTFVVRFTFFGLYFRVYNMLGQIYFIGLVHYGICVFRLTTNGPRLPSLLLRLTNDPWSKIKPHYFTNPWSSTIDVLWHLHVQWLNMRNLTNWNTMSWKWRQKNFPFSYKSLCVFTWLIPFPSILGGDGMFGSYGWRFDFPRVLVEKGTKSRSDTGSWCPSEKILRLQVRGEGL